MRPLRLATTLALAVGLLAAAPPSYADAPATLTLTAYGAVEPR